MAVIVSVLVATASPAFAHDEFRFVGVVTKVDTQKHRISITFKENGKEETVAVNLTAKTTISRDGKPAARTALRVGTNVVVDALGDDYDDSDAVDVKIVPAPKSAPR